MPRSICWAAKPAASPTSMVLQGITLERLARPAGLRHAFDHFTQSLDTHDTMESMDRRCNRRWASSPFATGRCPGSVAGRPADRGPLRRERRRVPARRRPQMVENFCIARRLVEAGARFVSLNYSRWDWHGGDGMNYPEVARRISAARHGLVGSRHRSARARARQRCLGRGVGRVRPHAQDQQQQQPRPLAARQRLRCWPAAACGPDRSSARPTATANTPASAR